MPLHPEYQALLAQLAELDGPPLSEMPVEAAREMFRVAQPIREDLELAQITNTEVAGPASSIPIRVYQPATDGPHPLVFMFHGGGWVIGDLDTADGQSREVAIGADVVVISVDYRLAPEHRFPAAAEDCYAAVCDVERLAAEFNADTSRIALAGDSAGGNLAAVVAQMVRDQGGPELRFQLLVYPVTDGVNLERPSYEENAEGYMLTKESMEWFWSEYCAEAEDRTNPYASPILAKDLSDLPPALVQTAEFDPLRDEGEAYGRALGNARNQVEIKRYDGFIHGFFAHSAQLPSTAIAMQDACTALKEALK